MKLLPLLLILPQLAIAQLKYSVDTLSIADSNVVIMRSSNKQLEDFKLLGSKAHGISLRLQKLQPQLDEMKNTLLNDGEIYDYYIANAEMLLNDIKAFYSRFLINVYVQELDFYKFIKAKQDAEEENVH